jgi:tetratricopeptide (TPR) repeat protein
LRWISILVLVMLAGTARADDAAAKALFDEGRVLFAEGTYGAACKKLRASFELNKLSGTGAMLGACYEKLGRFASAWSAYRDAASLAEKQGNADRAAAARALADGLKPKLAWLTIDATAVTRAEVSIDGVVQPPDSLGSAIPVDAGPHVLEATALDHKPWQHTIDIQDGEKQQVTIPALVVDPTRRLALEKRVADERRIVRRRKLMAYTFIGAGAASLAVASTLGVLANQQWDRARAAGCNDNGTCPSGPGLDEVNGAATKADLATYVGAAGVLLVGAGIFVRLTTPKQRAERELRLMPAVSGSSAGVALGGRF